MKWPREVWVEKRSKRTHLWEGIARKRIKPGS